MGLIELVNGLADYVLLLTELEEREHKIFIDSHEPMPLFIKSVSLSYSTITLVLKIEVADTKVLSTYLLCKFSLDGQSVSSPDVYCERKDRVIDIENYILQNAPTCYPPVIIANNRMYDKETQDYLMIADEIARQAYLCSRGDDYYPGNFSEILIEKDQIKLKQINHFNSRSRDHKDDYHLRDLEFCIPFALIEPVRKYDDEQIGRMLIYFSDRSSKNNKSCGDRIREKINTERVRYEQAV